MPSDLSQESCTEHCMSMLRGELPYHAKFYAIKSKAKSGEGKPDAITLVAPTQQQVLQAKISTATRAKKSYKRTVN